MSGELKSDLQKMDWSKLGSAFRRSQDSKLVAAPMKPADHDTYESYVQDCHDCGIAVRLSQAFWLAVKARVI